AAEAPIFREANLERAWLEGIFDYSDFTGADLTGARFGGLNPRDSQGNIRGPILRGAKFVKTTMKGVILERADLSFADFSGSQLDGANLQSANLTRTIFRDASLRSANLSAALLDGTDWTNAVVP
ncbi:pentapeptide repeat-containing protein, partial [Hyphomicrobium sp.]|uniref:pentapeptide repeat-containing protein n=1 Tax=Hyphomicrobium sp. TaxID=82 RepID=UPI002FE3420F